MCTLSEKASGTRSGQTYRFSEGLSHWQTLQITGDVALVPEDLLVIKHGARMMLCSVGKFFDI